MGECDNPVPGKSVLLQKGTLEKYTGQVCLIQSGYFPENQGSLYTQAFNNVRIIFEQGEYRVNYDLTYRGLSFNAHHKFPKEYGFETVNSGNGGELIGKKPNNTFFLRLNDTVFTLMPAKDAKPEDLEHMLEKLVKRPRQLSVSDIRQFFPSAKRIWAKRNS